MSVSARLRATLLFPSRNRFPYPILALLRGILRASLHSICTIIPTERNIVLIATIILGSLQ